jgi:hypothetical protein
VQLYRTIGLKWGIAIVCGIAILNLTSKVAPLKNLYKDKLK